MLNLSIFFYYLIHIKLFYIDFILFMKKMEKALDEN